MNEHRIVCAWCGKILVKGPPPISHRICESCRDKVILELKGIDSDEKTKIK